MKPLVVVCALITAFFSTQLFPITDFQRLVIDHFQLTPKKSKITKATRCNCKQCRERAKQRADLDEEAITILGYFAGIIGNFINILQNPKNDANVGTNLGGMLHGLANIVATAIRSRHDLLDTMGTEAFEAELEKLVATKARIIPHSCV